MIKLGGGIGGWGLGTGKARQRQGKARYVQAYPGMSRHVQAKERRGKSVKTGGGICCREGDYVPRLALTPTESTAYTNKNKTSTSWAGTLEDCIISVRTEYQYQSV